MSTGRIDQKIVLDEDNPIMARLERVVKDLDYYELEHLGERATVELWRNTMPQGKFRWFARVMFRRGAKGKGRITKIISRTSFESADDACGPLLRDLEGFVDGFLYRDRLAMKG